MDVVFVFRKSRLRHVMPFEELVEKVRGAEEEPLFVIVTRFVEEGFEDRFWGVLVLVAPTMVTVAVPRMVMDSV